MMILQLVVTPHVIQLLIIVFIAPLNRREEEHAQASMREFVRQVAGDEQMCAWCGGVARGL